MKIQRIGKDFIVTSGLKTLATFDNFDVARTFLADRGNSDAAKPITNKQTKRSKEAVDTHKLNIDGWRYY